LGGEDAVVGGLDGVRRAQRVCDGCCVVSLFLRFARASLAQLLLLLLLLLLVCGGGRGGVRLRCARAWLLGRGGG
jgi:hypothetical protein